MHGASRSSESIGMEQFLAADHMVVMREGRSQEIAERRIADLGLVRRVVLRSPHVMSVPHLVATTDVISIVPRAVGRLLSCAYIGSIPEGRASPGILGGLHHHYARA
jgi:DNA-binding transcriptional LysR family regulator